MYIYLPLCVGRLKAVTPTYVPPDYGGECYACCVLGRSSSDIVRLFDGLRTETLGVWRPVCSAVDV